MQGSFFDIENDIYFDRHHKDVAFGHGKRLFPDAIDQMARDGHLAVIKEMHKVGIPCTVHTMREALINGHLEVVKYLAKINTDINELDVLLTIELGHLECLVFLIDTYEFENISISEMMAHAAKHKQYKIVDYLLHICV